MNLPKFDQNIFSLDTSTVDAFLSMIESTWNFSTYGVNREFTIKTTTDDVFEYFINTYPNIHYKVFYGNTIILWTDNFFVKFNGYLMPRKDQVIKLYDCDILFCGHYLAVRTAVKNFDNYFEDAIIPPHNRVTMVIQGTHGLERITLPVKTERHFYPEIYQPVIPNPDNFISDFLNSSANVLILMGPAGLGKSALINEIILRAGLPTQIVFDKEVMKNEKLYTSFISSALNDGGGLMIMEDADNILRDRETFNNDMMSRLLNLSDGIVDTAGAKFIFSANINNRDDVDSALTRPGRCFDVVEFRELDYNEALNLANAIGTDLYKKKDSYTIAEIFNGTSNRKVKRKVGF